MWYPINGGTEPTVSLPSGPETITIDVTNAPSGADLDNFVQSMRDLDVNEAVDLGFAPVKVDEQVDHRTIVLDAMKFKEIENVRWGVGLRFTLHAWTEKGSVQGSIALVAAQASLNIASTRSEFKIIGFDAAMVSDKLPSFGEMTVDSYADLLKSIDACEKAIMSAKPEDLHPHPVAVFAESNEHAATRRGGIHWPRILGDRG